MSIGVPRAGEEGAEAKAIEELRQGELYVSVSEMVIGIRGTSVFIVSNSGSTAGAASSSGKTGAEVAVALCIVFFAKAIRREEELRIDEGAEAVPLTAESDGSLCEASAQSAFKKIRLTPCHQDHQPLLSSGTSYRLLAC